MAQAYSGVLGSLGLCLVIVRGLLLGHPANHVLTSGLVVFFVVALLGFSIGYVADKSLQESEENCFKKEMANANSIAASKSL